MSGMSADFALPFYPILPSASVKNRRTLLKLKRGRHNGCGVLFCECSFLERKGTSYIFFCSLWFITTIALGNFLRFNYITHVIWFKGLTERFS